MNKKFGNEAVLLGIISTIALVSFLGIHSAAYGIVNSINEDNPPNLSIVKQQGNTTIANSSNTITIGIGPNVLITNGKSQIVTKTMNFTAGNKLTVAPSSTTAGLNIGSVSSDPTSLTNGDMWINSFNNAIKYRVSGSTGYVAVLSSLVNKQTWSNALNVWPFTSDFQGTALFKSGTIVQRNPTSTFGTTIVGGAVTSNQTLKLPAINGTDTLATLGLPQTFTQTTTFSAGINTAGNITSTAASGHTFKISAPSGAAICIGTC